VFDLVRTARLTLRRPDSGDTQAFFQVDGDPATNRFSLAGPAPNLAASEERLCEWLRQWHEDGYGYWALAVAPDATVVGFGGVRHITWRDREVLNLYFKLQPAFWRRGYATELARTAVDLARAYLPHLPIIARTRPNNLASARTAERAGLLRRRDLDTAEHLIFALGWR
jgi:RimJ/RimL family protein N-acetyltransferase